MLRVTWIQAKRLVITGINTGGYAFPLLWDIPTGVNISQFLSTHTYGDGSADIGYGSMTVDDENTIYWGPTVPDDNWCDQPVKVIGELTYAADDLQLKELSYYYEPWHCDCISLSGTRCALGTVQKKNNNGGFDYATGYPAPSLRSTNGRGQVYREYKNFEYRFSMNRIDFSYDYYSNGSFVRRESGHQSNTSFSYAAISNLQPFDPFIVVNNYKNMIGYVRRYFQFKIGPSLRTAVYEWEATLDAVQGFHPYDINMVEALFQFSVEDLVPIGTSSKVLDILTRAVSSHGGLMSPKGILFLSQIFANCYLYYKYVALGDFSDITEIVLGTDKPAIAETVRAVFSADPGYKPSNENEKLKQLAQRIVYRDKRLLSSYGYQSESLITHLGEGVVQTHARLKAYPKYYKDMSTAAIICEEVGLSLSIERLAAIVPYEFIAEWFVPIEETIRSIENNSDRLAMMYEVKNLCLSRKVLINLDMDFLKAMYGLTDATGSLSVKDYRRHSQAVFPPTTPDLTLRPSFTLSRVMQGTSLLITRFS